MELTEKQQKTLNVVLDCIIPPSPERSLPGASEVGIWAFIVRLANSEAAGIAEDIDWLGMQAAELLGEALEDVDKAQTLRCLARIREANPGRLDQLARLTMSCYYQHDAVLAGIGMEPRPPFPLGHTVVPGNLTLLEPVKQRGPIFRRV